MWYLYLSEPPFSHLDTARFVTCSRSPSSCWVIPFFLRHSAINLPVSFALIIAHPLHSALPYLFLALVRKGKYGRQMTEIARFEASCPLYTNATCIIEENQGKRTPPLVDLCPHCTVLHISLSVQEHLPQKTAAFETTEDFPGFLRKSPLRLTYVSGCIYHAARRNA